MAGTLNTFMRTTRDLFDGFPPASSLPEGIDTLQFSDKAHIENALAIGPKVP